MALLPTPLTPAQADGALNIGEARVLFREGPHEGQFLMISATDPNLPGALISGEVQAQGVNLAFAGVTQRTLTVTLPNGSPVPNPPSAYPVVARINLIGDMPLGQSFAAFSVDGSQQTLQATQSGSSPNLMYSVPWIIPAAGNHSLEMLVASGHVGTLVYSAAAPLPAAPTNTVPPAITGTARQGQTLTISNGTWTGSPTFARQWKADGVNIAGATANTYALVAGDVGKVITCTVTGTNAGGNASATSAPTTAVLPLAPANTALPTITGTSEVGQTLTVNNGTWTGSPTFTRQWMADGSNIAGATAATFVLTAAEDAMMITCRVTGTNAGGSANATSAAVGPVTSP